MNKKTLGWVMLLLVLVSAAIFFRERLLSNSTKSLEQPVTAIVAQDTIATQPSGSSSVSRIKAEAELRRKTEELLDRIDATRRRLRDRASPEVHEKHAGYKVRRYEDLFRSWNLTEKSVTDSLQILIERDKKLVEIDNKMLDKKIARLDYVKAIKEYRLEAERKLSDIIGPELSVQFSIWDKPPSASQRQSKKD